MAALCIKLFNIQVMRSIIALMLVAFLLTVALSKSIEKVIKLSNFPIQGPFIFLTKLHIAAGQGQMDISYRKDSEISSDSFYQDVSIGVLNQSLYRSFSLKSTCQQKQQLLFKKEKFNLGRERQGMKHVKLLDLQESAEWYFYLFSCNVKEEELTNNTEEIHVVFGITNNNSHFGVNEYLIPAYVVFVALWVIIVISFGATMASLLSEFRPNPIKLVAFGGLILMGVAYLYELIHLLIYYSDGSGVALFHIFYIILRGIGQAIITSMMVSFAWGWSIIHIKGSWFYIGIGAAAGVVNIICLALSSLTEEHESINHHYETVAGSIVLGLRIVILVIFLAGLIDSFKNSSGKIIYFFRKLGLVGAIYFLCWPITVLIVELTLPNDIHRLSIALVQEFVHIYAAAALCYMLNEPESAYRKVSLQDDDNPLKIGDYKHK